MMTLTTILLLAAGVAPEPADVLAHVREATGTAALAARTEGLMIKGDASVMGAEGPFTLLLDGTGRFSVEVGGRLPRTVAFDGTTVWEIDYNGIPRVLQLGDRAQALLGVYAATGQWLAAGSPVRFSPASEDEQTVTLPFEMDGGRAAGTVTVDRATWLPKGAEWTISGRPVKVALKGYADHGGVKLPAEWEEQEHGSSERYTAASVEPAPTFIRDPYAPRLAAARPARFDASVPAALDVKKAPTGHLLVKPTIDGKDLGWFIYDTGAGASVISLPVAEREGLESFGSVPVVGVGGSSSSAMWKAGRIQAGPATIDEPIFIGLDLAFLTQPMGVEIAGVLGYDVLARVVTEVNLAAGTVALHDPATYRLAEGGEWTEMVLAGRHPCIRGSFEGGTGLFKIDTGAGSIAVTFNAPTVERLKLLEGRQTKPSGMGGVGGMVRAQSGELEWFSVGGHRREHVPAIFATENKGAFAETYTAGTVGGGIIGRWTLVLDYTRRRMALVGAAQDP